MFASMLTMYLLWSATITTYFGLLCATKVSPSEFLHEHHYGFVDVAGDRRSSLTITVKIPSRNLSYIVETQPSIEIFARNFSATHIDKYGVSRTLEIDKTQFHKGTVNGAEHSLAHFHIRDDGLVDGIIHTAEDQWHIEPEHRYVKNVRRRSSSHIMFSYKDVKPEAVERIGGHCGTSNRHNHFYRESRSLDPHPSSPAAIAPTLRRHARYVRASEYGATDCRQAGGNCDCTLSLIADKSFLESEFAESSPTIAMQYMVNMAINSNAIYRNTVFEGVIKGLGIAVAMVAIDESSRINNDLPEPTDLLAAFSSIHSTTSFCQAHLFTHRNYQGTLGLAYIGTLCSSDNTGFHSSYGVATTVQMLTFTHELGHGWGSNHDTTSDCAPGNNYGGNYIMYPSATDGTRPNNVKFSNCSAAEIWETLKDAGCFVRATAHCGNGIVEAGEDCDCGVDCTSLSCCTSDCTVNTDAGYACSPQDPIRFPCCTPEDGSANQCQLVPAAAALVCDDEDNCDAAATCNGTSASCPPGQAFPDLVTECECINDDCTTNPHTGPKVCMGGLCNTSKCVLTGATECSLGACDLSCIGSGWGNGSECISSFDTANRHRNVTHGVHLAPGRTCDNFNGYCNQNGECQSVGNDLAARWREQGAAFFTSYWWALFLALACAYAIHLGVRRLYRTKRRDGYDSITGADSILNQRFLNPAMAPSRDGFDSAAPVPSDSSDSDAADSDLEDQQVVDQYERERRNVIFQHYKNGFSSATSEEDLDVFAGKLKETILKGHLDQKHVMDLRIVYTDKLNSLRGFKSDKDFLKASFDQICGIVDQTRGETAKIWHATKRKTKTSIKNFKKEVENQKYIYY